MTPRERLMRALGFKQVDMIPASDSYARQFFEDETFRNKLVIWGGLNSHLVAQGTYETVRGHVREAIAACRGFEGGMVGTGSNYILTSPDVAIAIYHGFRSKDGVVDKGISLPGVEECELIRSENECGHGATACGTA